jgi:hypothetical protein
MNKVTIREHAPTVARHRSVSPVQQQFLLLDQTQNFRRKRRYILWTYCPPSDDYYVYRCDTSVRLPRLAVKNPLYLYIFLKRVESTRHNAVKNCPAESTGQTLAWPPLLCRAEPPGRGPVVIQAVFSGREIDKKPGSRITRQSPSGNTRYY